MFITLTSINGTKDKRLKKELDSYLYINIGK